MKKIIIEFKPDFIVDMIAFNKEEAQILVNIVKNYNIKTNILMISSIDVYSAYAKINKTENVKYQKCPIKEEDQLRKELGIEGINYDKLNIEKLYLENFVNILILRIPAVYGWPDNTRIEKYLIPMLKKEEKIEISKDRIDWKFSRILHKNVAFAIILLIKAKKLGKHIYNVSEKIHYTESEWCEKIGKIVGWKGKIIKNNEIIENVNLKQDFYVSSEKIRSELGFYEKYNPEEGLKENIFFQAYEFINKQYKKYY